MSKVQTMPLEIWTDINGNAARTQFKGGTKYIRADAQATVEALQAIIKQMGEQAAVLAKDGMAAKAQVEALQRERDALKTEVYDQKKLAEKYWKEAREADNKRVASAAALRDERERLRSTIRTLCSSGNRLLDDLIGRSDAAESFKYHIKQAQAALTPAGGRAG